MADGMMWWTPRWSWSPLWPRPRSAVGGADGASVSLARDGRMGTATDDTVAQVDRDQYATGQGPCLAAAGEGTLVPCGVGGRGSTVA